VRFRLAPLHRRLEPGVFIPQDPTGIGQLLGFVVREHHW
jgi:hypothetical protein